MGSAEVVKSRGVDSAEVVKSRGVDSAEVVKSRGVDSAEVVSSRRVDSAEVVNSGEDASGVSMGVVVVKAVGRTEGCVGWIITLTVRCDVPRRLDTLQVTIGLPFTVTTMSFPFSLGSVTLLILHE